MHRERIGLILAFSIIAFSVLSVSPWCFVTVSPAGSRERGVAGATALTVFAASSLTDAFRDAGAAFERRGPGTKVTFSFGASSVLRAQVEQGAPADLIAVADRDQLTSLIRARRVRPPVEIARSRLVIVTPAANPGHVDHPRDLARPALRLVVTAPTVPIGRYTELVLEKMSGRGAFGPQYAVAVRRNVVSREPNVRGLLSRVMLGEVDAAIVYASDARAAGARVRTIPIPRRYNVTAIYAAAVVAGSPNALRAAEFLRFVRSPAGRRILKRHGFE